MLFSVIEPRFRARAARSLVTVPAILYRRMLHVIYII